MTIIITIRHLQIAAMVSAAAVQETPHRQNHYQLQYLPYTPHHPKIMFVISTTTTIMQQVHPMQMQ